VVQLMDEEGPDEQEGAGEEAGSTPAPLGLLVVDVVDAELASRWTAGGTCSTALLLD
jgi:hypothetical protein